MVGNLKHCFQLLRPVCKFSVRFKPWSTRRTDKVTLRKLWKWWIYSFLTKFGGHFWPCRQEWVKKELIDSLCFCRIFIKEFADRACHLNLHNRISANFAVRSFRCPWPRVQRKKWRKDFRVRAQELLLSDKTAPTPPSPSNIPKLLLLLLLLLLNPNECGRDTMPRSVNGGEIDWSLLPIIKWQNDPTAKASWLKALHPPPPPRLPLGPPIFKSHQALFESWTSNLISKVWLPYGIILGWLWVLLWKTIPYT